MSKITAIEVQKRFKNRYNIFVDEEFAFGVTEETLFQFGLHKGMELPDELKEKVINDNAFQKVYSQALHYLSYALRSEYEVRQKLQENPDYTAEMIEKTIQKLKDERYIDDAYYTEAFIQTALQVTQKGKFIIEQALIKKGIAADIIAKGLQSISLDTELNLAIELGNKYIARQRHLSQKSLKEKTKQYIIQKGFNFKIAELALREIDWVYNEDDEWENLIVQGERVWQRYRLKYEGYTLKQKVSQALYQKGFSTDLIKRFVREKLEE